MTQTVLLLFFMLTPSFGFAEGNHGRDTRLLHPNAEPRVQFLTKEMVQLLESDDSANRSLGWHSVQAKLRELLESKKQVVRDDALKLFDIIMKIPSVDAQRTLILLFEVSPESISNMLERSHKEAMVEDCAFLARVFNSERSGDKRLLEVALRELLVANDHDPRSTAQLVRDVFKVPNGAVDPRVEEDRQRNLKLVAIALAYHRDALPSGLSRSDLIGILANASHNPNWLPAAPIKPPLMMEESARAFRRVLTPIDKETSLADILKSSLIKQWDGRRSIPEDLVKKNFSSIKLAPKTRWIAVRSSLSDMPGSIRCLSGCLTQKPFLIEPGSAFAIFGVIPSSDLSEQPVVSFGIERVQLSLPPPPPPPPRGRMGMPPKMPLPPLPIVPGVSRNAPRVLVPVGITKIGELPDAGQPFPFPSPGTVSVIQATEDLNVPKLTGDLLGIGAAAEARKYIWATQKPGPEGGVVFAGSPPKFVEYTVSFPVLTYARSLEQALQANGFLTERVPSEPIEMAAHRSFVRLQLLLSMANSHVGAKDRSVSARVTYVYQALPIVSYEIARRYLPELEQQALLLDSSYAELRKTHALVKSGLASLARLSGEDAFALLGYAAYSLRIEKPQVINDKAQMATALSGAEENLRRELTNVAERKAMTCRLIRLFQFPGTSLLPAVLSGEKIKKACAN